MRARRPSELILVAAWLGTLGCRDATGPLPLPAGATPYVAPAVYARWWAQTAACSGLRGDLSAYRWYAVPGEVLTLPGGRRAAAYSQVSDRRIIVAERFREDGSVVRHEMLHALLGTTEGEGHAAHPPIYFQGRCEGWVACPAVGCLDAGPSPYRVADAAPVRSVAGLDIRTDVTPVAVSRTGADPWLTVVVSVSYPEPLGVWVPLESPPDQSPTTAEVGGFGYAITDPTGQFTFEGVWGLVPRARVPFAPGHTRRFVVDVNAATFPAGEYRAIGRYNTRVTATPFRILP